MAPRQESFGHLPDGRTVTRYHLSHESGIRMSVLDYGAIIQGLEVPDREGRTGDVCLGYARLEDFLQANAYCGALVGRVAGRVSNGVYEWGGQSFRLERNEPPNHLHGGKRGFSNRLWEVETLSDASALRLRTISPDGEGGYPGNLEVSVTYRLTAERTLRIEVEAKTDRVTPFAPTQHAYFNLSAGSEATVDDHVLQIAAAHYVPIDEKFRLAGRMEAVQSGSNDFRRPLRLGDVMRDALPTHGDMYVLEQAQGEALQTVASVSHAASGRRMVVATTENCLQLYTGKFLDAESVLGKDGVRYPAYAGLCLECQGYPDTAFAGISASILQPGERFRSLTEYRFSTS